jgi:hypothetical protein
MIFETVFRRRFGKGFYTISATMAGKESRYPASVGTIQPST